MGRSSNNHRTNLRKETIKQRGGYVPKLEKKNYRKQKKKTNMAQRYQWDYNQIAQENHPNTPKIIKPKKKKEAIFSNIPCESKREIWMILQFITLNPKTHH